MLIKRTEELQEDLQANSRDGKDAADFLKALTPTRSILRKICGLEGSLPIIYLHC